MSAKRVKKSQKAPDVAGPPNSSFIDKASFMEGLRLNDGNPLHSTALEDDLNPVEEEQMDKAKAERGGNPQKLKINAKQRGADKKINRRAPAEKNKSRPVKGGKGDKKEGEPEVSSSEESDSSITPHTSTKPPPKSSIRRQVIGKRGSAGRTSASRPLKKQQMKDLESTNEADSEPSDDSESQNPSPKKARKSSSGNERAVAESSRTDKQRGKRSGRRATTELDVVLDAFLDFCDEYRETVASKSVKQSIDSFSSNVKEQILEKLSTQKELRVLKRENAKVASLVKTKTQRLLDAKHELMRAERQVKLLQKEEAELKLRLDDLKRSRTFLCDIRGLNQQYLDYRKQHPSEQETYGASSLPALLLETQHVQAAEHQLKKLNDQMEKRLKKLNDQMEKRLKKSHAFN